MKTTAVKPVCDYAPPDSERDQLFATDNPMLAARQLGHGPLDFTRVD